MKKYDIDFDNLSDHFADNYDFADEGTILWWNDTEKTFNISSSNIVPVLQVGQEKIKFADEEI